jgi:hypothetical protein
LVIPLTYNAIKKVMMSKKLPFKQVQRTHLYEKVADQIKTAIFDGLRGRHSCLLFPCHGISSGTGPRFWPLPIESNPGNKK